MTVGELKKLLQEVDDDDLVVVSKDAEGNDHSPLAYTSKSMYVAETTWMGTVYERGTLTEVARNAGYSEEDFRQIGEDGAVPCLTLWPVN